MANRNKVIDWLKAQARSLKPSFLGKTPHFNFITAHYIYIVTSSIIGSILIYASGNGAVSYIDALFFSSGASTQAGLNPIDVNMLNTFQQVVLYLQAMMCNPITINTSVVFLRLYWFEKRFMHIVKEARKRRGTMSKSRAESVFENAANDVEQGVNGRDITVMHGRGNPRITNDGILLPPVAQETGQNGAATGPSLRLPDDDIDPLTPEPIGGRSRDIRFAQSVKRSDASEEDALKLPTPRTTEEHLAILERQRNEDQEVLRIPGPREVERGMAPQRVSHSDDNEPEPHSPRPRALSMDSEVERPGSVPRPRHQTIVIEEPTKPQRREEMAEDLEVIKNVFSPFYKLRTPRIFRRRSPKLHQDDGGDDEDRGRRREAHQSQQPRKRQLSGLRRVLSHDQGTEGTPYLSWTPTIGRNSNFAGMSEEQREEVGGIEYRSLKALAKVLLFYYFGFSIFAVMCMLPWIRLTDQYGAVVDAASQSRTWWGFFTANSAFMDLGFTLTPDSMVSFNTAAFPLLIMSFLIIIGNTGFPVMLRFLIWLTSRLIPRHSGLWEELRFLLDHPRRCFTLLFPSGATWWLFGILVLLNGLDLIFFIVLDLGSGPVNDMPTGMKILNGVFQAASTRTAGFASVNISALHPAVQTSYLIMMYISVFPIAISVRRTNVYEESSLGVYGGSGLDEEGNSGSDLSYVGAHLRRQLSFDLWYIAIGFFILSISEGDRLQKGDFSMFAVLFEIVSAYGTVGLSMGYTGINASLVSQFSTFGKLVIVAMQIRGRHRGLPYGLDRAVLLPSDSRNKNEEALAEAKLADARLARRVSGISTGTHFAGTPSVRRMRSRSMDRVNSNILTQLLHPGPPHTPHHHGISVFPARTMSATNLEDVDHDHLGVGRPAARRAEMMGQTPTTSPRPATTPRH